MTPNQAPALTEIRAPSAVNLVECDTDWTRPARVRVANGALHWQGRAGAPADPPDLDDFLALADAPDADIKAFAEKYGALELCEHGLPIPLGVPEPPCGRCRDSRRRLVKGEAPTRAGKRVSSWARGPVWQEPVDHWRKWARRFVAFDIIRRDLTHGRVSFDAEKMESWGVLLDEDPADVERSFLLRADALDITEDGIEATRSLPDQVALTRSRRTRDRWLAILRAELTAMLNGWLRLTYSELRATWTAQSHPTIVFAAKGLFGYVVSQVAQTAAVDDRLERCTHCARLYAPKRVASTGQRRFCEDCRKHRSTYAHRDRRARQAATA